MEDCQNCPGSGQLERWVKNQSKLISRKYRPLCHVVRSLHFSPVSLHSQEVFFHAGVSDPDIGLPDYSFFVLSNIDEGTSINIKIKCPVSENSKSSI